MLKCARSTEALLARVLSKCVGCAINHEIDRAIAGLRIDLLDRFLERPPSVGAHPCLKGLPRSLLTLEKNQVFPGFLN